MPRPRKKVVPPVADNKAEITATSADKAESVPKISLEERLDRIETRLDLVTESFEWAADQVRPMFGQGALAVIFDAISNALKKGGLK